MFLESQQKKSTSFVTCTSSVSVCILIQKKDYIKQATIVLGVLFSNYSWFQARWCLILFLVSGKSLNPNGNHLLAQRSKIPRSTSFVHILILVELLVIYVQNFFPACMSLNTYCCASLRNCIPGLLNIGFNAC